MPEMRHYKVVQIREVKVTANSTVDALRLASAAFEHGQDSNGAIVAGKGPEGVWGNTDSRVKEISLHADRII